MKLFKIRGPRIFSAQNYAVLVLFSACITQSITHL